MSHCSFRLLRCQILLIFHICFQLHLLCSAVDFFFFFFSSLFYDQFSCFSIFFFLHKVSSTIKVIPMFRKLVGSLFHCSLYCFSNMFLFSFSSAVKIIPVFLKQSIDTSLFCTRSQFEHVWTRVSLFHFNRSPQCVSVTFSFVAVMIHTK